MRIPSGVTVMVGCECFLEISPQERCEAAACPTQLELPAVDIAIACCVDSKLLLLQQVNETF